MLRLRDCEGYTAFSATITRTTEEQIHVTLHPIAEEILCPMIHPLNRGFSSIIEATVHATRYLRTKDPALMRLIEHHMSLVKRCGGKRELEALGMLQGYLGIRGS
jgi:hypothetical protein